MTDKILIFDTTLRDGEQSPGFSMNLDEKLQIGHALERLGVDVIEAGFPAASPGDFEAVQALSRVIKRTTICGLARCVDSDIDRAAEALADAASPRLHVFLATSAIHREHKLKVAKGEIIKRTIAGVERARRHCADVEYSPEDASRTEPEFLAEVVKAAIDAGASTINIPDTVGYAVPHEFGSLFRYLVENVDGIGDVTLSAHCHNDLGLAVANSLVAIESGARQIECTINGIGERAGNCSLEELVMALHTRHAYYGLSCAVDTTRLCPTSRVLSSITGVEVQPNKAIVGANAFAHEAGIHQHGVLQHSATYEIMRPKDVGYSGERLVLGKHSGRHALRDKIQKLGYELDEEAIDRLFDEFKKLADRKKVVLDADLEALVVSSGIRPPGVWSIEAMHTSAGTGTLPTASVRLRHEDGRLSESAAIGDGPIDAAFQAMARAAGFELGRDLVLSDYHVRSVTLGEDAQGQVTLQCELRGRKFRGQGVSTDTVEASALAFCDVINQCCNAPTGAAPGGLTEDPPTIPSGI